MIVLTPAIPRTLKLTLGFTLELMSALIQLPTRVGQATDAE
jgi:hypothetical protein